MALSQETVDTFHFISFLAVTVIFLLCAAYAARFSLRHFRLQDHPSCASWTRLGRPHAIGALVAFSSLFRALWAVMRAIESYEREREDGEPVEAHKKARQHDVDTNGPFYRCLNRISMLLQFTAISIVVERWYASQNQTSRPGSFLCGIINSLMWICTLGIQFIDGKTAYGLSSSSRDLYYLLSVQQVLFRYLILLQQVLFQSLLLL